jgi:TPR repeat protein
MIKTISKLNNKMELSRYIFVLVCVLGLIFSEQAKADTCEGDNLIIPDGKTMQLVQELADAGSTKAQAQIGVAYLIGKGILVDKNKARSWLEKSAAGGSSEGQYWLAEMLVMNPRSEIDVHDATEWLKKSANQGCMPALLGLGVLTKAGRGVPKNVQSGIEMIQKAAEAGIVSAQMFLGGILVTGDEITINTKIGFDWVRRAATTGDSKAEIFLANLYLTGTGTKANFEKSRELLESVFAKKDDQAHVAAYQLGWMYMEGKGGSVDLARAFKWMYVAAQSHYEDSEKRLQKIIDDLPKQQITTSCSVYEDDQLEILYPTKYGKADVSDTIATLQVKGNSVGVYFPVRKQIGFISPKCLLVR